METDSVTVNEGENIRFVCSLESNPKSEMTLQKGDQIKVTKTDTYITYEITSSNCDDAELYVCLGRNQFNTHWLQRNISLFVECKFCTIIFSTSYSSTSSLLMRMQTHAHATELMCNCEKYVVVFTIFMCQTVSCNYELNIVVYTIIRCHWNALSYTNTLLLYYLLCTGLRWDIVCDAPVDAMLSSNKKCNIKLIDGRPNLPWQLEFLICDCNWHLYYHHPFCLFFDRCIDFWDNLIVHCIILSVQVLLD